VRQRHQTRQLRAFSHLGTHLTPCAVSAAGIRCAGSA
jgi:hypothetical protein